MTNNWQRGLTRMVAIIVLTIGIVFLLQLANLALATRQARRNEVGQRAEVASLATQVSAIQTATYYAQSEEEVERRAREDLELARPGDQVLVPVPENPPVATPSATRTDTDSDPLRRLWHWLQGREAGPSSPAPP